MGCKWLLVLNIHGVKPVGTTDEHHLLLLSHESVWEDKGDRFGLVLSNKPSDANGAS